MKKHSVFDCYGANKLILDDIKYINDTLTKLCYQLKLTPICPPQLVPYYYGKVKADIGVSAFVLLEGGHVTIHTFPIRECYFVDILYDGDFDHQKAYNFLLEELPFNEEKSFHNTKNRDKMIFNELPYDPNVDFGPHIMSEIICDKIPNMETFFDFLERVVSEIHMDPITRPLVLKSRMKNPRYLSSIIVIAQSHIALHYNYKTKHIYADIFSCAPFDYSKMQNIYQPLGKLVSNELTARGSKHIYKIPQNAKENLKANMKWQKVINR